jgi:hypothetical protein
MVTLLSRYALGMSAAAALLAGCGGLQEPIGAPGAVPQSQTSAVAAHAGGDGSWMLPEAKNRGALLYVTGGCGGACVLSYPRGELVGQLNVGEGANSGVCTDARGDVYISNSTSVVEYTHGGTIPIATFNLPGNDAAGCSVDPTSGNLAVEFTGPEDNIAVFSPDSDSPNLYVSNTDGFSIAYDDQGNLFAGGINFAGGVNNEASGLTELPAGGSQFVTVSMPNVGFPGQVQWVGSHLAYETIGKHETHVYRLTITGSTATVAGTTHIVGPVWSYYSWIYGKKIIIPYSGHTGSGGGAQNVGVWRFPRGGRAVVKYKKFGGPGDDLQSVVISP